jgi:hypothetical protein
MPLAGAFIILKYARNAIRTAYAKLPLMIRIPLTMIISETQNSCNVLVKTEFLSETRIIRSKVPK